MSAALFADTPHADAAPMGAGAIRPCLTPGDAISYWQVTPLSEARYDVPDSPMEGEMDSTFFLTKDKNVIPHTYPCRTAYIAEQRAKEIAPAPAPDWSGARNVLPQGSPFLDLSGFWFRATRVRGWARTSIEAETAGIARLQLGICGAAKVFVNGSPAAWLSPATRNAMDEAEFDAPLVEGKNEIVVQFEDLAERDAVIRVALTWLDGPAARAADTFPGGPGHVAQVEAAIDAMHLDAKLYDDAEIWLELPVPFPDAVTGSIRVAGHFMSHDHDEFPLEIPAGATRVLLAHSRDLPADYRYFDFSMSCGDFATLARLGAEISWRAHTPAAPDALDARIAETITWIARHAETDTETALACADLGDPKALARAVQIIETILPGIEDCFDCADFALVPLLWTRIRYADRLPQALVARIDAATLAFRYWMDEPGNDVQWYFSENHALLFHTAAYLAGHLHANTQFARSGRIGADQSRVGFDRLMSWFDHFEAAEMAEFNSTTYFPIDLKGLSAIFALAPDACLRERAGRAIIRLVTMVAHSAHHGVVTAAQGRSYEHSLCVADTAEMTMLARLLWGKGNFSAHVNCLTQIALCLRDHALKLPDLAAIANWQDPTRAQEWMFWQGNDAFARLYHYKTSETALGSAVRYRWGDWGYQETLIQARIGREPSAACFINHPGEIVQSGFGRPSFWGGSANVPRVQQYRGLAIVWFDGVTPQPDFTHAWFPTGAFDEWTLSGAVAGARSGQGALALRASGPLELLRNGGSSGNELRLVGRDGLWVMRLGHADELHAFLAIHPLVAVLEQGEVLLVEDAEYGTVRFHPDGRVEGEGRVLDPAVWTMEGIRTEMAYA